MAAGRNVGLRESSLWFYKEESGACLAGDNDPGEEKLGAEKVMDAGVHSGLEVGGT